MRMECMQEEHYIITLYRQMNKVTTATSYHFFWTSSFHASSSLSRHSSHQPHKASPGLKMMKPGKLILFFGHSAIPTMSGSLES